MTTQLSKCPVCDLDAVVSSGMRLCEFHRHPTHVLALKLALQENNRAIKRELVADLSIRQLSVMLRYFGTKNNKTFVWVWKCAYCNCVCEPGLDHWKPLSLGGMSTFTNVIPCCYSCNIIKSASTGDEFLDYMIKFWRSPVAVEAKERIGIYWNLVGQGLDVVLNSIK